MKRRACVLILVTLPLSACGGFDSLFSPYYFPQYNSYGPQSYNPYAYGTSYGRIEQSKTPGYLDRGRATGVVSLEGGIGREYMGGGKLIRSSDMGEGLSMRDAFNAGTRYDVSATYPRSSEGRYFTGTAYRTDFNGRTQNLSASRSLPIRGRISDYKAHGVEFGVRQYSPQPIKIIHPFIEGRLGGAYVDDIFVQNDAGRTRLYQSGWVPTATALVGFEAPAFEPFSVGVETGVKVQGRLEADKGFAARSVNSRTTSGSAVTIPLTLRGRYRF